MPLQPSCAMHMGLRKRSRTPTKEASCPAPPSSGPVSPHEKKKQKKQHKRNKPSLIVTLRIRFEPPVPYTVQPQPSARSPTLGKRKTPPVEGSLPTPPKESLPTPPKIPAVSPAAQAQKSDASPKAKPAPRPTTAKSTRRTAPAARQRQRQPKPAQNTQPTTTASPTLDLPPLPPPDPRATLAGGLDYSSSMAHWIESVARERAREDAARRKGDVVTETMDFGGPKWPQREYPGGPWKEC